MILGPWMTLQCSAVPIKQHWLRQWMWQSWRDHQLVQACNAATTHRFRSRTLQTFKARKWPNPIKDLPFKKRKTSRNNKNPITEGKKNFQALEMMEHTVNTAGVIEIVDPCGMRKGRQVGEAIPSEHAARFVTKTLYALDATHIICSYTRMHLMVKLHKMDTQSPYTQNDYNASIYTNAGKQWSLRKTNIYGIAYIPVCKLHSSLVFITASPWAYCDAFFSSWFL